MAELPAMSGPETARDDGPVSICRSQPLAVMERLRAACQSVSIVVAAPARGIVACVSALTVPRVRKTVLETFSGYVDQVVDDTAYVRLESREHGDVLHGQYSASELASKGIHEQSRFLCETVKVGGSTRLDLKALPDEVVSEEELRAIDERIHRVIPRDDPGIEY